MTQTKTITVAKIAAVTIACLAIITSIAAATHKSASNRDQIAQLSEENITLKKELEELKTELSAMDDLRTHAEDLQNTVDELQKELAEANAIIESKTATAEPMSVTTDEKAVDVPEVNTIEILEPLDVQITAKIGLNIRKEANITSAILGSLGYRTVTKVDLNDSTPDWYKLKDREGYISKQYTTTKIVLAETITPTPTPKPIATPKEDSVVYMTAPIDHIDGDVMTVNVPSNLTAAEFNTLIDQLVADGPYPNSTLVGIGDTLVELEATYGINGILALSIAGQESGFGTVYAAKRQNNPLGIMGKSGVASYETTHDAFMHFGRFMKSGYIDIGLTTISSIGSKYCPGYPEWAGYITYFWNKLTAYL